MNKHEYILDAYNQLRTRGIIHTQKDFANLLGFNQASLSRAFNGDEKYLTDSLIGKVQALLDKGESAVNPENVAMFPALDSTGVDATGTRVTTLPVIPVEAMAGTLGEFSRSVALYDCEKIVSPIKGADYAIRVSGESMSPEYPNGSQVLIKKINENAFIEWGKVYVLDTDNGAVIKVVRKTNDSHVIECVPLNPEFQPFTIDTKYIHGWYRVLMVLATK